MPSKTKELLFWKEELERWQDACREAERTILEEILLERPEPKDFFRQQKKLRTVVMLVSHAIEAAAESAPSWFEEKEERKRWDRGLTAAHSIIHPFRSGIVLKTVLPLLGLREAGTKIESYCIRLGEIARLSLKAMKTADEYVSNWSDSEEIMRSFGREPRMPLMRLYASYATFPHDHEFDSFAGLLEKTANDTITVIIEDSITLFLMIADDFFQILVRIPFIERPEELYREEESRKSIEADLTDLLQHFTTMLRNSEERKLLSRLLRHAVRHALESWKKEEKNLRKTHDEEQRKRFLSQFREGFIL